MIFVLASLCHNIQCFAYVPNNYVGILFCSINMSAVLY